MSVSALQEVGELYAVSTATAPPWAATVLDPGASGGRPALEQFSSAASTMRDIVSTVSIGKLLDGGTGRESMTA